MIDSADSRPPYRQVADRLRDAISRGELRPGDKLPSVRELSSRYGITHVTADQALKVLKAEGLVDVQPGRGTFVRQPKPLVHVSSNYLTQRPGTERAVWTSEAERQGLAATQEIRDVSIIAAPPEIAERLGIAAGDSTVVRRRVMTVEGEPVQLADSYFPRSLAEGTPLAEPRKVRGGVIAALERLGVQVERFHEDWSFRMPTPDEVREVWLG